MGNERFMFALKLARCPHRDKAGSEYVARRARLTRPSGQALPRPERSQGYNRQFERRTATLLQFLAGDTAASTAVQLMHRKRLMIDKREGLSQHCESRSDVLAGDGVQLKLVCCPRSLAPTLVALP